MPLIKWLDKYNINIEDMDDQHKKWIGCINRLYEAKQAEKDIDLILKLLDDVIDYTETHFIQEEELIKQHGYKDYDNHKAIHDSLIRELMTLRQRFGTKSQNLPTKVLQLLNNWVVDHIMKVDRKYGVYLNSKGVT
tara:strand:- start:79 stop:486 length:408 start_codon:yes stop_codon:yes gene_type:complete